MAEYLEPIVVEGDASLYRINGDGPDRVDRYIASSPETRMVCNTPEIVGLELRRLIRRGMWKALMPSSDAESIKSTKPEYQHNILTIMRGGLNFDWAGALNHFSGMNCPNQSFMTSERFMTDTDNGDWQTRDTQYCKFTVEPGSIIYCGDIMATGTTLQMALAKLYSTVSGLKGAELPEDIRRCLVEDLGGQMRQSFDETPGGERTPIQRIIFYTIGGKRAEDILGRYAKHFSVLFPETFSGCSVYYAEGRFGVASDESGPTIRTPGTDLLRYPGLLAPEFEISQFDDVSRILEKCIVYDGGSRMCSPKKSMGEIIRYWQNVNELAQDGMTLLDAMSERWPMEDILDCNTPDGLSRYAHNRVTTWRNIPGWSAARIHEYHTERWDEGFLREADRPQELQQVALTRITDLDKVIKSM